jgi:hypothetical protein
VGLAALEKDSRAGEMKIDKAKTYELIDLSLVGTRDDSLAHLMYLNYSDKTDWWYGSFCHYKTPQGALRAMRRYYNSKSIVLREKE